MAASVCENEDELKRDCITAIVHVAAAEAGFQDLKPEQMQAILEFINGHDIFVLLPTGYGKSLIYGLLPLSLSECREYPKIHLPLFAVAYRSSSSPSQSMTLYRRA